MVNKKAQALLDLKRRMEGDKSLPLRDTATQLVFGEGNPDTDIYFLGEAPGYHEDKHGRPFVGQAGQLLNKLLEGNGLKREDVYISNIVRFRPPENRDPLPQEIEAFKKYIEEEISIVDPRIIVTLGRFSMNKFLPSFKISQVHGKVYPMKWQDQPRVIIPMYHPAAALRATAILDQLKQDFKVILKTLGEAKKTKTEQLPLI
ncbi:MAG: uracil-DNA glycosylase [Candidatus Daviesbacteria bacterium]|nr:uracil-DNA glycosylase [Candidatus Daviesbacteria bacterium]